MPKSQHNCVSLIHSRYPYKYYIVIYFYSITFIPHFMNIEQYSLLQHIIKKYMYIFIIQRGEQFFDMIGYFS